MNCDKDGRVSGVLRARDETEDETHQEEEEEEFGAPFVYVGESNCGEEEAADEEEGNFGAWVGTNGDLESRVYFGVRGQVVCCDLGVIPATGASAAESDRDAGVPVVWEARVARPGESCGSVHVECVGERLFCCCGRTLSCLSAATGAVLWTCAVPVQAGVRGESEVSLVVDAEGGAVVATSCGAAVCAAQADGRVRWTYWLPVPAAECEHATPRLCGRAVVLAAERIVACIDADSGAELWCREVAQHEQFMPSVAWDGAARLVLCGSGYLRRLDHATGALVAPPVALAGLTPAAVVFDALRRHFVVAAAGSVWCFSDDAANTRLWHMALAHPLAQRFSSLTQRFSSLALEEGSGTVFLAAGGRVVALTPNGDVRWSASHPAFAMLTTLLYDETGSGTLLVCSVGKVFVLDPATGRTLACRRLTPSSLWDSFSAPTAPVSAATAHHAMDPSAACCAINPLALVSFRENFAVISSYFTSPSSSPSASPSVPAAAAPAVPSSM